MMPVNDDDIFIPMASNIKRRKSVVAEFKKPINEFKDGSIKKLVLINFMVHQRFELNFDPHVNIITGPNGSGKSAVLQAIVLALGTCQFAFKVSELV